MANRAFQLQRSRIAVIFQLIVFMLLMGLLYKLMSPISWLLCLLFAAGAYVYHLKVAPVVSFEHLDQQEWSLCSLNAKHMQRVSISHIIDHQLYMVVYFQPLQQKPLLIWIDQLSRVQWKALKQLAKLQ